jgi:hypothetical protein
MFEIGDIVICPSRLVMGYGFVVETKNKDNYKSLKAEWYAICFFARPYEQPRWYEGHELQKASK